MATMVKEKRREKKKSKQKPVVSLSEFPSDPILAIPDDPQISEVDKTTQEDELSRSSSVEGHDITDKYSENILGNSTITDPRVLSIQEEVPSPSEAEPATQVLEDNYVTKAESSTQSTDTVYEYAYTDLNLKLERVCIPTTSEPLTQERELALEADAAYIKALEMEHASLDANVILEALEAHEHLVTEAEDVVPSAPMLDFEEPQVLYQEQVAAAEVPKLISMPLEEAIQMYVGTEIAEVMAMSEKEEAVVEAGSISGPEHPLVDLLSTFKRSLIAMERERNQLIVNFVEEEKYRNSLWKIEKRYIQEVENCACGEGVHFKGTYEHAEFQKDKLPIARMKLESLLRDIQESFCHHQHAALLAYCQIEEFISDTVDSSKSQIREALTLILQALKRTDNAPAVLSSALRRWACALAAALVDARDLRQLLFLLHHLFRQTRSVRWAASFINLTVTDSCSAARTIALLDILLTRPRFEAAVECTEGSSDKDEDWEELGKDGGGGAVSDGTLRERDMLAMLRAFPLRALVARLALVTQCDLTQSRPWQWGDVSGGRDVMRACCGVRALLGVLARAVAAHAHYTRLLRALRYVALSALRALAALHERNRQQYSKDLELKIQAELEAAFVQGCGVLAPAEIYRLPAGLLSCHAANDYCNGLIDNLHSTQTHRAESLSLSLPVRECGERVSCVACCAAARARDYSLARTALQFLFQSGVRRNALPCNGSCRRAAREQLPQLLAAHTHLYAVALHLVAETSQVEKLDPSAINCLAMDKWRPQSGEIRAVAEDWARRCPHLLPPLLLNLHYTPHTGVSLDTQLAIGSWLCEYVRSRSPSELEEWCWGVLRRLRVHRTCWGMRPDAPPPEPDPNDLFSKAYALMASSWGHSIPLICSEGVSALCSLGAARVGDAVQCLAPLMLLLVDSPESVASTDKFTEFFSLVLSSGPGLVQRALGRGAPSGASLLARLMHSQLAGESCGGVPHSALVRVWIWALWRPSLPSAIALLDGALRPRDCWQLDEFALNSYEEAWEPQMTTAMRMASQAPLICYAALRAWHAQREQNVGLLAQLELALYAQRAAGQRIHVANALKYLTPSKQAEDLVIYRLAGALLSAPLSHAANLLLWAMFMHLYLRRSQSQHATLPVGPLFYSGLIKSRTLAQLKRRLQDAVKHHQTEAKRLSAEYPEPSPTPQTSRSASQSRTQDELFAISITDFMSESSDLSESDESEREEREEAKGTSYDEDQNKRNAKLAIAYHNAAERMLTKYAEWLDEGENVRTPVHEADIARFIPANVQEAAWELSSSQRAATPSAEPEPLPLPPAQPPPPPAPEHTPYETLMDVLMKIRNPKKRGSCRSSLKSPVDDVKFKDVPSLLRLVENHLADLRKLAKEWSSEVSQVSNLNSALFKLVQELRVSRPLPTMRKACSNKCAPVLCTPRGREWCISVGAVQGIKENRAKALACVRRLARPRPHVARTAAALLTIAGRLRNVDEAKRVAELTLRAAPPTPCGAATISLAAFLDQLAERWLCSDGVACAYLIRRSYSNTNALSMVASLVAPQKARPSDVPALHSALLRGPLPPHVLFSFLSRFDMSRWADAVTPAERKEILGELTEAARRWGASTDPDSQVVLDLVGLQSAAVCRETELCSFVAACCRACAEGWLPPLHLPHVARAAECAPALPYEQLGHLHREIGVIWWEARTGLKGAKHARYAAYAPHVARLLSVLHRAFVGAAVRLSYAPKRVGPLAWSSLLESWSAWVVPHSAAPLLPSTGDEENYTPMLERFFETVLQVMEVCPGTEEYLLSQIFEWAVQTYLGVQGAPGQEARVQLSAFLAQLAKAPWHQHQWLQGMSLQVLLQASQLGDKELGAWCSAAISEQQAATWLRDTPHELLPSRLSLLLHLLTAAALQHRRVLEEATRLPWHRLPEAALEEALDRFFAQHYSVAVPYHDLPQFKLLLFAGELYWPADSSLNISSSSRQKRGRLVSQWVRAASAPGLLPHVAGHSRHLLAAIAAAAPHLAGSAGEVEELLGRALVIMCIEPAAAAAFAVWEPWIRSAPPVLRTAVVRCVSNLTAFEYYAPLADVAVRTYLTSAECSGWSSITALWAEGHWREATPLCARARLHAAYATLLAYEHTDGSISAALLAIVAATVDYVENEAIVALWICAACRLALSGTGGAGTVRAAGALLRHCASPPRRSLLQVVALQGCSTTPAPPHRLLALYALCVLSPESADEARAFESACGSVSGLTPDVATWGRTPHLKRLPELAMRLFPKYHKYFKEELDVAPEETA